MRLPADSPLLRFFRDADLRTAAFLASVSFLLVGMWVGQAFDLWGTFVEDVFTDCLPATVCPAADQPDPVSAELMTFGLLSLGGIAAVLFAVLLLLRSGRPDEAVR